MYIVLKTGEATKTLRKYRHEDFVFDVLPFQSPLPLPPPLKTTKL